PWAAAGGLLFGFTLFLSYGLILLALIPMGVAAARGRLRPVALAAAGVLVVAAVFAAAGFQWVDGLRATLPQYAHSVARLRPQNYFVYGNLGAFALVLGPAAGAGLGRLRDRRAWLVVGSAMAAVLLADLSGLSKGEAERIWIPFVPWVLIAAGALATRDTP